VEGCHELARLLPFAPDGCDRAQRIHIGVVEVEHAVVVGKRLLVAVELLEEDFGAVVQDLDTAVVAVGDVVLALEHVAELGPLAADS